MKTSGFTFAALIAFSFALVLGCMRSQPQEVIDAALGVAVE